MSASPVRSFEITPAAPLRTASSASSCEMFPDRMTTGNVGATPLGTNDAFDAIHSRHDKIQAAARPACRFQLLQTIVKVTRFHDVDFGEALAKVMTQRLAKQVMVVGEHQAHDEYLASMRRLMRLSTLPCQGEVQREAAARPGRALHLDAAAKAGDDAMDDGQSQTGALGYGLRRKEGVEGTFDHIAGHPHAIVAAHHADELSRFHAESAMPHRRRSSRAPSQVRSCRSCVPIACAALEMRFMRTSCSCEPSATTSPRYPSRVTDLDVRRKAALGKSKRALNQCGDCDTLVAHDLPSTEHEDIAHQPLSLRHGIENPAPAALPWRCRVTPR